MSQNVNWEFVSVFLKGATVGLILSFLTEYNIYTI